MKALKPDADALAGEIICRVCGKKITISHHFGTKGNGHRILR